MRKSNLSKVGIKVVRELTEKEKRFISNDIADKLRDKYPYLNFSYLDIVFILYNTRMYVSKNLKEISSVNYIYQNQSIYFSEKKDIFDIDESTIYECIHRIQDRRNKKGRLMQLGNCEFTDTKIKGLTFNEMAIQYIVSNILKRPKRKVKVQDIIVKTCSPQHNPLMSNLIEQLVLLLGEKKIVQSTICGNNDFNYQIIDALGEKEFFEIRTNFDKIQELQDKINKKNQNENIIKIKEIFYKTQKIIYEKYFDRMLDYIDNIAEIESTNKQLDLYSYFILDSEKIDEFKMFEKNIRIELDKLESKIKAKYALVPVNKTFWNKLSFKVKNLLNHGNSGEYYK